MKGKNISRIEKSDRVMYLVSKMDEARLSALLYLVGQMTVGVEGKGKNIYVSERIASYQRSSARASRSQKLSSHNHKIGMIAELTERLNSKQLGAVLTLIDNEPEIDIDLTDDDIRELDASWARFERGETQGIPAEESIRLIKANLLKKRRR